MSEDDRRRLEALAPGMRGVSIPTGVDTDYFTPNGYREAAGAARVQRLDGLASQRGRRPLFRGRDPAADPAAVPDASFTIVGLQPDGPRVRELAIAAGIVVTGTVDDVRPWIGEAAVYVVPLAPAAARA